MKHILITILLFLSLYARAQNGPPLWTLQWAPDKNSLVATFDTSGMYSHTTFQAFVDTLYSLGLLKTDSIYISNDTIFLRDGKGHVDLTSLGGGGVDSALYRNDSLMVFQGPDTIITNLSVFNIKFNGNRNVTNPLVNGANTGTTTLGNWLEYWYKLPYQQPSISMNSIPISIVEVGSSNTFTVSGSSSNPCTFTLSGGSVNFSGYTFGSSTSYSTSYTHAPTTQGTTTLTASQNWSETGSICLDGTPNSGTKTASRSANNVYPFFYGSSATDYSGSSSIPYSTFSANKRLVLEGGQSMTFNIPSGTPQYFYILIPKDWSDNLTDFIPSSIKDPSGFETYPSSWTGYDITVTSTGLTNNWTRNYKMWKWNTLTHTDGNNFIYVLLL